MHSGNEQSQSLQGRTAIVTGSGQNIGRAIALAYARNGANVVINGHSNLETIEAVAAEARALGVKAIAVRADVGDSEAVEQMVERTANELGSVDIVVSNVSVRHHQPFLDISVEDWNQIINSNLSASFYLAKFAIPHMIKRGWGRVINISGRDGFFPKINRAHNVTCKAGVFALAKAIAVEFGQVGITANAIAPGIIETTRDPVHYPNFEKEYEARRQAMPVRRLGTTDDIAESCLYLCSQAGGFVTGQILHVNGGEFMA
ncbi:SDR family NAD(P)-dependent oxidoreductase [Caballeronia sp. 15715]|uniref:SDR family NAD(P)-dependent oxidoreductase n=1 Tax=unclassified Caballeronia TaxID=2646786 RepID=UPI0039E22517